MSSRSPAWIWFAVAVLWACDSGSPPPPPATNVATTGETVAQTPLEPPHVPAEPGRLQPILMKVEEPYDPKIHEDFQVCAQCHADIVEQWKDSPKALASLANPFFRASFDEFVEDAGTEKSLFCGGCHDPTLVVDESIRKPVPADDRRAHLGITCAHCHGISEVSLDGNVSHTLSTAPIPFPTPGDDESLQRHFARVAPPVLRTNDLCISCHKNFLTPLTGHDVVIPGINDGTPYMNSGYSGNPASRLDSVEQQTCISCHMPAQGPKNQGSHRFAGGHSTLAAAIGSDEQLAAIEKMVKGAATVDVAAVGVGRVAVGGEPPTRVAPGEQVWADVVVFNENTGHHFPGGARDLRDTWVEAEIVDASGKVLAQAGRDHEETGEDPNVVKLHTLLADTEGSMVPRHRVRQFRAPIIDRTVAPRDALVARFVWTVPEGVEPAMPLTVRAKLRHRRLHKPLEVRACADAKTERAKTFVRTTKEVLGHDMDPCVTQPVIEIGEAWAKLGAPEHSSEKPAWLRHYHRGMGLIHNLQENLPEAIEAFELAMTLVPADAPPLHPAMVNFQLGNVAARQGRTQDAMDFWAKSEALVGETAAIHFARGLAYQRVFRNDQATEWFRKAATLADDERIWRQLAIAAGSSSQPRIAYDAARAGLRLEPRDPFMLQSQMLALRALDADPAMQKQAEASFSAYKRDELAPEVRDRCSDADPMCREEREPMRVVEMVTVSP